MNSLNSTNEYSRSEFLNGTYDYSYEQSISIHLDQIISKYNIPFTQTSFSKMDQSIFTAKLRELSTNDDSTNSQRKKWLFLIKNYLLILRLNEVHEYFLQIKPESQLFLQKKFFNKWTKNMKTHSNRVKWIQIASLINKIEWHQKARDSSSRLDARRVEIASKYLISQKEYQNPKYNEFILRALPILTDKQRRIIEEELEEDRKADKNKSNDDNISQTEIKILDDSLEAVDRDISIIPTPESSPIQSPNSSPKKKKKKIVKKTLQIETNNSDKIIQKEINNSDEFTQKEMNKNDLDSIPLQEKKKENLQKPSKIIQSKSSPKPNQNKEKSKSNSKVFVVLSLLLLFASTFALAFAYFFHKSGCNNLNDYLNSLKQKILSPAKGDAKIDKLNGDGKLINEQKNKLEQQKVQHLNEEIDHSTSDESGKKGFNEEKV